MKVNAPVLRRSLLRDGLRHGRVVDPEDALEDTLAEAILVGGFPDDDPGTPGKSLDPGQALIARRVGIDAGFLALGLAIGVECLLIDAAEVAVLAEGCPGDDPSSVR